MLAQSEKVLFAAWVKEGFLVIYVMHSMCLLIFISTNTMPYAVPFCLPSPERYLEAMEKGTLSVLESFSRPHPSPFQFCCLRSY